MDIFKKIFLCSVALVSLSWHAHGRDVCLNPVEYTDLADELVALGPFPDQDKFQTISSKIGRLGMLADPFCIRFLIKTYISKMNANFDTDQVQKYLESENSMFVSPDECQATNIEDYINFGNEMGKLGPNPPSVEFNAVQDKYDYLFDRSVPCRKVVMVAYRQAYKETEIGRASCRERV